MPMRAQAQWWSSREPADYEDCAERAQETSDAKQRDSLIAACESKFAGRRKPGGGYSYYDFMQDRHFDIAGPNPTPQEQREIDQHYTAFLDQNRRSIIAAAFARKQRELTEAKLIAEAPPAAKPSGRSQAIKPTPNASPSASQTQPERQPATNRVVVASLTPPSLSTPIPTPRPSAAIRRANSAAAAKAKRDGCEPSLSCGLSRLGDGVSSLTKTIFGPPPKPKPGRS
uniref:Uncharacterized protein n=1 Tax=Rhodopseudomonas palustris (strain BisA53) TaxID=316055 RepID=Q07JL9_RHOP5